MTTNNKTIDSKISETITFKNYELVYSSVHGASVRQGYIFDNKIKAYIGIVDAQQKFSTCAITEKWLLLPVDVKPLFKLPIDAIETVLPIAENKPIESGKENFSIVPSQSINILESIINDAEKGSTGESIKADVKDAVKPSIEQTKTIENEVITPLTSDEKDKLKKLKRDYLNLDNTEKAIPFKKAKILSVIRDEKLFRDNYKTFTEFAIIELKLTREYAQNLAQYGAFILNSEECLSMADFSINSIARLTVNQSTNANTFGIKDASLSDFKSFNNAVIDITIDTAKDDNKKHIIVTPKIVDTANAVISDFLVSSNDLKFDDNTSDFDLLALVSEKLQVNKENLVSKAKSKLLEKVQPIEKEDCIHVQKIKFIDANNILTLECGCSFKLVK